ncbi:Aminopeptidase N [Nocardioides dokdonensis FR1436]|uniref:Aminopeptidase N n=1 Tax=Nocardioides dokdonensis FR1436 TaxID=1300347 RepID=A0A1A9GFI1_9ACTN|nr:aminopeptidase N [Nocardioides dokdonensis]ANH36816.1 Aminopeptidase N [Nocardioides dokdonensis FR1436]
MSLTLAEARARAAHVSDVAYEIDLDLSDHEGETFGSRTTVTFTTTEPSTFLELTDARDLAVSVDGRPVEAAYDGRRVGLVDLPVGTPVRVRVEARVPYVSDGDGMHRMTDPVDGETYVSAYLSLDIAQRVFACFDQPDLKATMAVGVSADPRWSVIGNGRVDALEGGRWRFATTPRLCPSLFVVCAGPWHSVTWEHAGLPFGWHARASLAAELDRDAAELQRTTTDCFDHFATLFDEAYPFDSYDQLFGPGHNWGAMETPGCVTYRDELLPRGRVTDDQRSRRATVIAHEMAHMWFGNLVTMRWWEDTWLNESFADYMGYRVAADGAGFPGTLVVHEATRKPAAYVADERRSTHPVAPLATDVPDVDAAFTNFDSISYAKGSSCLRQLVTWLGDEDFLAGVNAHLTRHRFDNATLDDLVGALDDASPRDVRGWAEVWLRRTGFDTIEVRRRTDDVPVLVRDGERPHRFSVSAFDDRGALVGTRVVDLEADPVPLPDWVGLAVVPNSHGESFVRLRLDPHSARVVAERLGSVGDDLVRTVLWAHAFDEVRTGASSTSAFLDLVSRHLPVERHPALVAAVLDRALGPVLTRSTPAAEAGALLDRVARACGEGLEATSDEEVRVALTRGLAATSRDADRLRGWLEDGRTDHGIDLDPGLRWSTVARLAALGDLDESAIEAERQRDQSFAGDLGAARALAARPTAEAKAAAWATMSAPDVSNRVFEACAHGLWDPERVALCTPYVDAYLADSPALCAHRGQGFSLVVGRNAFPALALSDAQRDRLASALASGDVPPVLARFWNDHLDDLT